MSDALHIVGPAPSIEFLGATGSGAITGSVAIMSPAPQVAFTDGIVGNLAIASPAPIIAFTGHPGITGEVSIAAPTPQMAFTGYHIITGSLDIVSPAPSLSITGLQGIAGTLSIESAAPTIAFDGLVGIVGTVAIALPAPLLALAGYVEITGSLDIKAPAPQFRFTGTLSGTATAYSLNLTGRQLTQFTNYTFNSFTVFNGVYLAANASGIFELAGDNDDGSAIDALLRTGVTDFGASRAKRVSHVWLGCRADGALSLRVITGEGDDYSYEVDAHHDGIRNVRVDPGRGLRARYWQFEVSNLDGCDFELDTMEVRPVMALGRHGG